MLNNNKRSFAGIPSVDAVLRTDILKRCLKVFGHAQTRDKVRKVLTELREQLQKNPTDSGNYSPVLLAATVEQELLLMNQKSLKPVFNLSGIVIHTNLGRAPLPREAIESLVAAADASNVEFDLATGRRGDRDDHVEQRLCQLTGAEAATVVNNNAAALVLVLNTLAKDKNVPVSRGELVEIGGSFRIPDIIATAGCLIKEIGTTNRTHLKDYANSIDDNTALLLKVHTSNYSIEGFTHAVDEQELAALARQHHIPVVVDLGSGSLIDLQNHGLPKEPQVREIVSAGIDVVTFSGDKLLGGPQAGIIVGKKHYIEQIKRNPLKRAVRVDKLIIAALEAVLKLYASPETLTEKLPTLRLLTRSIESIQHTANSVLPAIQQSLSEMATVNIVDCQSQIGSGALPLNVLPSKAIAITPQPRKGLTDKRLTEIAAAFRALAKPVIGRINDGTLFFDCRCLEDVENFVNQLDRLDIKA